MEDLFPPRVRKIIYVLVVLGTAVLVPLNSSGVVSDLVMSVWTSFSGAVSALAYLNVQQKSK